MDRLVTSGTDASPADKLCQEIARKDHIKYSDWLKLTGLRAPSDGESALPFFEIDERVGIWYRPWDTDFVRQAPDEMHLEAVDDNERGLRFEWGGSPSDLVSFVGADTSGALWLPDAFIAAVKASHAGQTVAQVTPPNVNGWATWKVSLLRAWPRIVAHYGRQPTAKDALRWAVDYGDPNVFVRDYNPVSEFRWIDGDGLEQRTGVAQVSNTVSAWRANRYIPKK